MSDSLNLSRMTYLGADSKKRGDKMLFIYRFVRDEPRGEPTRFTLTTEAYLELTPTKVYDLSKSENGYSISLRS